MTPVHERGKGIVIESIEHRIVRESRTGDFREEASVLAPVQHVNVVVNATLRWRHDEIGVPSR